MKDTLATKRALVIGAGLSGLVAAKELLDVGITDITIVEKDPDLGGVWRKYCWKSATLTSSKWMTEFGSFPIPSEYPDFLKPEQMMDYLRSFVTHFGLEDRMRFGVEVKEIALNSDGTYEVTTNQDIESKYDFVIISTGLHGKPSIRSVPGLENFKGTVMHGNSYSEPEQFKGKRVLCMGLGESGVGINSEISSVADRTVVSAGAYVGAIRVFPYSSKPFDQIQFWPIGRFMKDYQEVLTVQLSWITRLPEPLRSFYKNFHPILRAFPNEWVPKAYIPDYWAAKYWPKPNSTFGDMSGNLTRPGSPPDDILYLVKTGQIIPKGRVKELDENGATFVDGTREEIDIVVANTGYKAPVAAMKFPNDWEYCHKTLYKGCFHPDMPNLAFVGLVRPTIGSIPAMAEMQARLVAQQFSGQFELPEKEALRALIKKEADAHARQSPQMNDRWPHIYFFDQWMEEMAELIGCQPKLSDHLGSWKKMQAYWFGAPMPLRFRQYGPGSVADGCERYIDRVDKLYGKPPMSYVQLYITSMVFYPHLLALAIGAICFFAIHLSAAVSIGLAAVFWIAYMTSDVFRFLLSLPTQVITQQWLEDMLPWSNADLKSMSLLLSDGEKIDYNNPPVFESDVVAKT